MYQFTALFCIAAALPFAEPGYLSGQHYDNSGYNNFHHFDSGYPIQTIDLGTFVGKHHLKPNTIKVTRTVQVKVPVPYRVNVPHPLPYPVPVPKPYPVEVPKYIKVKEQVPVYVPVHSGGHHDHHHQHNGGSDGYSSNNQGYGQYQQGAGGYADHDEHAASNTVPAYQQHGIAQDNHGGYAQYSQQQQQQQQGDEGYSNGYNDQYQQQQPQYDQGHGSIENQQQHYDHDAHHDHHLQHIEEGQHQQHQYQQDEQQSGNDNHHYEQGEHGAYSGKQLIYTNPRHGIAAFALHDGNGNKGYHLEQAQESQSDDGASHSRIYKSEKRLAGTKASGEPTAGGDYYSKNYKKQVHEVREVHEEGSE